jgi:hypothetical protein
MGTIPASEETWGDHMQETCGSAGQNLIYGADASAQCLSLSLSGYKIGKNPISYNGLGGYHARGTENSCIMIRLY